MYERLAYGYIVLNPLFRQILQILVYSYLVDSAFWWVLCMVIVLQISFIFQTKVS